MRSDESTLPSPSRRRRTAPLLVFLGFCAVTTLGLGWAVVQGHRGMGELGLPALVLGLGLSATLIWGLPGPSFAGLPLRVSWRRFLLILLAAVLVLLVPGWFTTNPWQYLALIIVAEAVATVLMRSSLSRGEVAYSLALALVAGITGLGSGRNATYMAVQVWGLLQIGLTFFGFLAGWALMRRLGLFDKGMGTVLLLTAGPAAALRAAAEGAVLAVPFALVGIALGSADTEGWVVSWWQTLVALQPAIAEEAWGRVFPLSVLVFFLVRAASIRAAWLGALLVGIYWFANLHNFFLHVEGLTGVISAAAAGVLFVLPLTYVWLQRGQEAAFGFHFAMDFGKSVVALLINAGILT